VDFKERIMAIEEAVFAYLDGDEARDKLIDMVCRLVGIESVRSDPKPGRPFGDGPAHALAEALRLAEESGFQTTDYDHVIGVIRYNEEAPLLDILCHADVVSGGEGWTVTDPFAPKESDGKIYGRGSADDKGPFAAALLALIALKKQGVRLPFGVRIIVGTDEECGSEDLAYFLKHDRFAPHVFSPDAEFPVITTEKGMYRPHFEKRVPAGSAGLRLVSLKGGSSVNVVPARCECVLAEGANEIRLRTEGKEAHASSPHHGVNAITAMLLNLKKIAEEKPALREDEAFCSLMDLYALMPHGDYKGEALGIAAHDDVSGDLTLAFSMLSYDGSVIKGRFDSRLPLGTDKERCAGTVRERFDAIGFSVRGTVHPPHHVSPESPFVRTLLHAYETCTGLEGKCLSSGGATYVHDIEGGVAFGCEMPGRTTNMHGPDECVWTEDLIRSAMIFSKVILDIESQNKYN